MQLQNYLKNKILTKKIKLSIYNTMIRLTLIYATETITMAKGQEEELRIMERKGKILESIKISDTEYRTRINYEIFWRN